MTTQTHPSTGLKSPVYGELRGPTLSQTHHFPHTTITKTHAVCGILPCPALCRVKRKRKSLKQQNKPTFHCVIHVHVTHVHPPHQRTHAQPTPRLRSAAPRKRAASPNRPSTAVAAPPGIARASSFRSSAHLQAVSLLRRSAHQPQCRAKDDADRARRCSARPPTRPSGGTPALRGAELHRRDAQVGRK